MQLARTLAAEPDLLLLDEPSAGLDLGAREDCSARLGALATDPTVAPTVLVTHHVEEIPAGFTHVLLLRAGEVVAAGPLDRTLTEANLGDGVRPGGPPGTGGRPLAGVGEATRSRWPIVPTRHDRHHHHRRRSDRGHDRR